MKGRVKWFDEKKGYGFIIPDGGSVDVFVHHTGFALGGVNRLSAGERVEFEEESTERGVKAVDVMRIEDVREGEGRVD